MTQTNEYNRNILARVDADFVDFIYVYDKIDFILVDVKAAVNSLQILDTSISELFPDKRWLEIDFD